MAIDQTHIFPIDLQPRNAVGIAYPFSAQAVSGSIPFKSNYTTTDQTRSNLIIYFSTNKGERPLNPGYGGGLKLLLFEQITTNTFDVIEQTIIDGLASEFPHVNLKNLEVLENIENNSLTIVMSYTVFNNMEEDLEITFNA